jgi:putative endonuclease
VKYYTYILKSKIAEHYYIGSTNDLKRRINEHNTRKGHWTSRYQPWEIIHFEEFDNRSKAVVKEKRLKSKYGIEEKLRIIKHRE